MWGGPVFAEILKRKYLLKADTELQNSENLLKKKKKRVSEAKTASKSNCRLDDRLFKASLLMIWGWYQGYQTLKRAICAPKAYWVS